MRSVTVVAIAVVMLVSLLPVQSQAQAQDTGLFEALPTQADIPVGLAILDEGSRGASEIAAGFPDPREAARLLTEWGWQENAYRVFAAANQHTPEGLTTLEVSLHRFADIAGAAAASTYFSEGRAAVLGLESGGQLTLTGRVPGGVEITSYGQQGAILIHITAISHKPEEAASLGDLLSFVRRQLARQQQESYTSPQFGYEVVWDRDRMIVEGEVSQPGDYDELTLRSTQDPAYFVLVGMSVALPSIDTPEGVTPPPIYASPRFGYDVWRGAVLNAVYGFAEDRASHYPGSSISFSADWGTGATIYYTEFDGTEWVEAIGVAPFVSGDGLAFFIHGMTKELDEQYRPDMFSSIEVDLAAAADSAPPAQPPWDLDGLAGATMTPQVLAAALPPSFNGAFGSLVLQETFPRPPVPGVPGGTVYQYGPPGASEPSVTVIVHEGGFFRGDTSLRITPEEYIRLRANAVLQSWRRSTLSMVDVSLDAQVPFVLSNYASLANSAWPDKFTLIWGVRGGGWAVEIEAPDERDPEGLVRAWRANLAGIDS